MNNIFNLKIKSVLLGIIFLIPLFFIPSTVDVYVFNKQLLLFLIAPLILLIIGIKKIRNGDNVIDFTKIELVSFFFIFSLILATLFSVNSFYSLFGMYGNFSESLISHLAYISTFAALLYFLCKKEISSVELLKTILYSFSVVILSTALFSSFVIGDSIQFFSLTGGDAREIILVLVLIIPLLLLFELNKKSRGSISIFLNASFFVSIFIFGIYAELIHWIFLLIISLSIIFYIEDRGVRVIKKYKKTLVALVVILYFSLNIHSQISNINYFKPTLGIADSAFIVSQTLKEDFFFGVGPALFDESFSLHRPKELNLSVYWDERFVNSASSFLDILNGAGLLSAALFFIFLLSVLLKVSRIIIFHKKSSSLERQIVFYTSISLAYLVIIIFTQHMTFVLWLFFWIYLALVLSQERASDKKIMFNLKSYIAPGFAAVLILGWAVVSGYLIKNWIADTYASNGDESSIRKAISINSYRHNYYISLSKLYLDSAASKVNSADVDYGEISSILDNAKLYANKSISVAPTKVATYETLGVMYREIIPYVADSEILAIEAFLEAFKREPTNPVLANELGKLYLMIFQNDKAIEYFKMSKDLKNNYYWADFGLAQAYSQKGDHDTALSLLIEVDGKINTPEYYYEFGKNLYQSGKITESINYFVKATELSSNYSNALYSLAVAYEANGQKKDAHKYYVKVLDLNPTRRDLLEKVKELE